MPNPLRSEAEMFRVVVVVGIGAAVVIAVTALTEPVYGAIVLALELAAAVWWLWRSVREAKRRG